uniref:DNA binding protein n=1 Tax=Solanum tuberosum TaxID=4113 RepID=M1BW98_SOLTU
MIREHNNNKKALILNLIGCIGAYHFGGCTHKQEKDNSFILVCGSIDMLIQNYLSGCKETSFATTFSSEITKRASCDQGSGAELSEMSPEKDKCPLVVCIESDSKDGDPCSLNSLDGPRPSTFSAMSGSSKPIVYRRKKFKRNPLPTFFIEPSAEVRPSNGCPSELCSEVHSGTLKEGIVAAEKLATATPVLLPAECNRGNLLSKSNSCDGRPEGEEQCSEAASRSDMQRTSNVCINDSHSSSKCNLDFGSSSLKTVVDDAGECSSSGALFPERLGDNMPEKDICAAILRGYGLLEKVVVTKLQASTEDFYTSSDNCCLISCKTCDCSESTVKMLICDNCDDAYHLSCCKPHIKIAPEDEWFCQTCLIKKQKLLKKSSCNESSSNSPSEGVSGPTALMLKDTGYRTRVRISKKYQAEIPDWTGPVTEFRASYVLISFTLIYENLAYRNAINIYCYDIVVYLSCLYLLSVPAALVLMKRFDAEQSSNEHLRISSIGNWLQCRQVIEGVGKRVDGSICGKWRRYFMNRKLQYVFTVHRIFGISVTLPG